MLRRSEARVPPLLSCALEPALGARGALRREVPAPQLEGTPGARQLEQRVQPKINTLTHASKGNSREMPGPFHLVQAE